MDGITRSLDEQALVRTAHRVLPAGGFGNLIALPLQRRARERGDSLFVDDELRPHDDQWAFLASLARLDRAALTALVAEAETRGPGVLGVRMPVEDEDADEPWLLPPSRRREPEPVAGGGGCGGGCCGGACGSGAEATEAAEAPIDVEAGCACGSGGCGDACAPTAEEPATATR